MAASSAGAASMYVCNVVSKGIRRHITSEYTQQHFVCPESIISCGGNSFYPVGRPYTVGRLYTVSSTGGSHTAHIKVSRNADYEHEQPPDSLGGHPSSMTLKWQR